MKFELLTQRAKQLYDNPECGLSSQVATGNLEMAASPEQFSQVTNWMIARYIVTVCITVACKLCSKGVLCRTSSNIHIERKHSLVKLKSVLCMRACLDIIELTKNIVKTSSSCNLYSKSVPHLNVLELTKNIISDLKLLSA